MTYETEDGHKVTTGIESADDITLPHVLQAAIFMQSRQHRREIAKRVSPEEFVRLQALNAAINDINEPDNFPSNKALKVAVVTGHLAGRGNTLQSAYTGFTYTSMVFTDVSDNNQRGAVNAQRFGRACGLLMDAYAKRPPMILATRNIVDMAEKNEQVVLRKAHEYRESTKDKVSLKMFVSESEWSQY